MGKSTPLIRVSFAIPSAMSCEGAKPRKWESHVEAKAEVREKEEKTAKGLFRRRRPDSKAISVWK